jgi:hypothetical protein
MVVSSPHVTQKRFRISVAKGPKFRPQNTKGAEKNCVGPELVYVHHCKSNSLDYEIAIFWQIYQKRAETVIILAENCNFQLIYSIFLYYFALRIFEKSNNISLL